MYLYAPLAQRPAEAEGDPFRVDINSMVCSETPYKIVVLGQNNWSTLLSLDLTDDEAEALIEKMLAGRQKRREMKAATLAKLVESDYEPGALSLETGHALQRLAAHTFADHANDEPVIVDRCPIESMYGDRCGLDSGHDGDHVWALDPDAAADPFS